eukprot:jgi/Picsp_1/6216/NSC_03570-R1_protein
MKLINHDHVNIKYDAHCRRIYFTRMASYITLMSGSRCCRLATCLEAANHGTSWRSARTDRSVTHEYNIFRASKYSPSHLQLLRTRSPGSSSVASRKALRASNRSSDVETYPGMYGDWKIEQSDIIEVWTYRICISIFTAAFVSETLANVLQLPSHVLNDNAVCALGAAALGMSLVQIHIYVTPIKRALQSLWLAGVLGSLWILVAQSGTSSVLDYVVQNRWGVWITGPMFAALTGMAFKEGLCYGKPEAFVLSLGIPIWQLSHLFGIVKDDSVEGGLAVIISILMAVFAARKYTQPIKDDIGDGSVFKFQKMTDAEKQALLEQLGEKEATPI